MKAVAPHAEGVEAPRNRQPPRHRRQIVMKGRVEARDMGNGGQPAHEHLDQAHLRGQMLRIERFEFPEFVEEGRGNRLAGGIRGPAVDDPVSHAVQ